MLRTSSHHNGVHFFDISTSKRGPKMVCFVHFDLEMCFAPQRRALFRHRNFQKWSEHVRAWCVLYILTSKCASHIFAPQRHARFRHLNFQTWSKNGVFCTFWLRNVLRPTAACIFSTSQLPKVVRTCCVLYILTSKCASRHNGVQFLYLSSAPAALVSLLFDLPEPQIIGKTQCFATLLPFRAPRIFFLLRLSLF